MPTTANKGYSIPTTGTEAGIWGDDLNNNTFTVIDNNMGGVLSISTTGGVTTLTAAQAQNALIVVTGNIISDATINSPAKGFYYVDNRTTGPHAVLVTNSINPAVIIPQGTITPIFADATYGARAGSSGLLYAGMIIPYLGTGTYNAPWWGNNWIICNGQAVSRATYPFLFLNIGTTYGAGDGSTTFNVPDLRGRTLAGMDTMGAAAAGRMTAAGGLDGTILGQTGGEQTHVLNLAEIAIHSHGVTDPGHVHTIPQYQYGAPGAYIGCGGLNTPLNTQPNITGISIQNSGGGGAHNNTQPTMVCYWLIKT